MRVKKWLAIINGFEVYRQGTTDGSDFCRVVNGNSMAHKIYVVWSDTMRPEIRDDFTAVQLDTVLNWGRCFKKMIVTTLQR